MYIGRSEVGMLPKLLEWYKVKNTNWGEIPVTLSNLWSLAAAPGLPPPALIEKLPDEDTDTWLDRSPVKRLGLGPEIVWALRMKKIQFLREIGINHFLLLILYLFLITEALLPKLPDCKACARLWAIRAALPEGWLGVLGGVAKAEVGGDISFLSKLNCLSCCKDVLLLKDLFKNIMIKF